MQLIKSKIIEENGYLLMESLVTLSLILAILLILYPLIVDWLVFREEEKEIVEHKRMLYETSMQWPQDFSLSDNQNYLIVMTDSKLSISKNNKTYGVEIYEVEFE